MGVYNIIKFRVFISGAMASHELDEDREVARDAINSLLPEFGAYGYEPFAPDSPREPRDFRVVFDSGRREIAISQSLILLLGRKISSFCMDEFTFARKLGMPCAVFSKSVPNRHEKAERFLRNCGVSIFTYKELHNDLDEKVRQFCTTLLGSQAAQHSAEIVVCDLWRSLVERLKQRPENVYELSSRQFEELIAEMIHTFGYQVELTPRTRDGGRDIIALRSTDLVFPVRHLIEAKLWTPPRKVGRPVIDALFGVGTRERCNGVMVVTPSSFSLDAINAVNDFSLKHYVRLIDGSILPSWYNEYLQRTRIPYVPGT
jgi:hypothetical protein